MKRTTIVCLLCLAVAGCDQSAPAAVDTTSAGSTASAVKPPSSVAEAPTAKPEPLVATDVGRVLARVESEIDFRQRVAARGRSWMAFEALAGAFLTRARLTGNIDDYTEAGRAVDRAFGVAVEGAGPFFTRAHYNFSIHRVLEVEADLVSDEKSLLRKSDDRERTAGLRGDVALHSGNLAGARKRYDEAMAIQKTLATVARRAYLDLKTGNLDEARRGYEEAIALAKSDIGQKAWAMLQRGIVDLEAGDAKAALIWFEQANETFSGWYLIEEHLAEARGLTGDLDGSIALYESIVARTPNGEFLAALSEAYAARGDTTRATESLADARAAFDRDLGKLPSVATGHALRFFLEHDKARALELAEENFALRPSHEARMLLAQAHLTSGTPAKARDVLKPVVGSEWADPEFLATVEIAYIGTKPPRRSAAAEPEAVSELRARLGLPE